jgi:catechol 2,3-dioxygenase-like lactoylglutathione lyase family enzyme
MAATITGVVTVILTVTDPERSAAWYRQLLSMEEAGRYVHTDGRIGQICLSEPLTGLDICLGSHGTDTAGPFDEHRTGLDHLEFLVSRRADLEDWVAHLDTLGIAHSGVKQPHHGPNAMVTFRDPDNIQLEFFWKPSPADRRPQTAP